jgi:predicted amidohydrolase
VCLPEMAPTGYFCQADAPSDPDFFDLAEPADGPTVTAFRELAAELGLCVVLGWFERAAPGLYYNTAGLVDDRGTLLGCYRKAHTAWSATAAEKFYVRPGDRLPVFDSPLGRIGLLICYDRDFPEAARTLALRGAQLVCLPTALSVRIGDVWDHVLRTRAYENQVFVIGAGMTGSPGPGQEGFNGRSMVVGPDGAPLGQLGREESVLVVDVDLGAVEAARRARPRDRDRRPELYGAVTEW